MKKEEEEIRVNGTFSFVDRLPEMNVIPCKYVFKVKNRRHQMDVVTDFLNGDLNEIMYMAVTAVFSSKINRDKVCQLHKALYCLKQVLRQWSSKINSFQTRALNFRTTSHEPVHYIRHEEKREKNDGTAQSRIPLPNSRRRRSIYILKSVKLL